MTLHETVARVGATAVVAVAVAGSTSALLAVGIHSEMALPPALPVTLDGSALIAAMAIRRRPRDWLAWASLVVLAGLSAAVQWMSAPDGTVPHLAHVSLPLGALLAFELFLRAVAPTMPAPVAVPVPVPSVDQQKEVGTGVASETVDQPRMLVVGRSAPVDASDLVPVARKLLADADLSPHQVGRPRLTRVMRGEGYQLGTRKAETLLSLLREEAPA